VVLEKFFKCISQSKTRIVHVFCPIYRCSIPNFIPFGKGVSEEKIFNVSANQKQKSSMAAMFVV